MRVNDVDFTFADFFRQIPRHAKVATGTAIQTNEIAAIREVFLAELANAIEAEHRRRNSIAQTTNRLFYQHFRTGNLHDV